MCASCFVVHLILFVTCRIACEGRGGWSVGAVFKKGSSEPYKRTSDQVPRVTGQIMVGSSEHEALNVEATFESLVCFEARPRELKRLEKELQAGRQLRKLMSARILSHFHNAFIAGWVHVGWVLVMGADEVKNVVALLEAQKCPTIKGILCQDIRALAKDGKEAQVSADSASS